MYNLKLKAKDLTVIIEALKEYKAVVKAAGKNKLITDSEAIGYDIDRVLNKVCDSIK